MNINNRSFGLQTSKREVRLLVCVAIIPARNEEETIADTLGSLFLQTRLPDKVIVVANNCTDNTANVARQSGAEVLVMNENKHMKAGALNYALDMVIPDLDEQDCILIMDADTLLSEDLVEQCIQVLNENEHAGAVGSIFTGRRVSSFLGYLQVMEYWRYKRQIHRNGNRAFVLSGTASVFRVGGLTAVKEGRNNGIIPYGGGGYYDVFGRTEDNEITLALLMLDFDCPSANTTSITDVMESPKQLYRQRERWYNGALVNLKAYGRSLPWYLRWVYWKQQFGLLFSLSFLFSWLSLMLASYLFLDGITVTALWFVPVIILSFERTLTVWQLGWKARIIAITVIPEQLYSIFLLLVYGLALKNFVIGHRGQWHTT
jgi:cellulose synthase/poly-beta-1,6-N-acetylglucosamine synthase-like glycosyltransferase